MKQKCQHLTIEAYIIRNCYYDRLSMALLPVVSFLTATRLVRSAMWEHLLLAKMHHHRRQASRVGDREAILRSYTKRKMCLAVPARIVSRPRSTQLGPLLPVNHVEASESNG